MGEIKETASARRARRTATATAFVCSFARSKCLQNRHCESSCAHDVSCAAFEEVTREGVLDHPAVSKMRLSRSSSTARKLDGGTPLESRASKVPRLSPLPSSPSATVARAGMNCAGVSGFLTARTKSSCHPAPRVRTALVASPRKGRATGRSSAASLTRLPPCSTNPRPPLPRSLRARDSAHLLPPARHDARRACGSPLQARGRGLARDFGNPRRQISGRGVEAPCGDRARGALRSRRAPLSSSRPRATRTRLRLAISRARAFENLVSVCFLG